MSYYAAALRDIDNPISEDYKPYPNDTMQVEFLQINKQFLLDRIAVWNQRYSVGNSKEQANITKIIAELNKKVSAYDAAIAQKAFTQSVDETNSAGLINSTPSSSGTISGDSSSGTVSGMTTPTTAAGSASASTKPASKKIWWIAAILAAVVITTTVIIVKRRKKS